MTSDVPSAENSIVWHVRWDSCHEKKLSIFGTIWTQIKTEIDIILVGLDDDNPVKLAPFHLILFIEELSRIPEQTSSVSSLISNSFPQAIHMGLNCKQYQQRMTEESESDENAKQTREMLDKMVKNGEALKCPTCHVIMMKKWGCDWLRCSMCKTEICWVTRGPRWGPAGKGDTSGGCQCGMNGVKCHPKCNYCHWWRF